MNKKKKLTTKEAFALAVQNHQKNNLKVAENLYKETLKINPNHVNAHNNLGIVLKEFGDLKKAKSCYEKAIQLDPNYVNAHNNLGIVLKEFGDLTGEYIILNTSLNILGEPIICHPREAIRCFFDNGLDYLIMENYIISKNMTYEI